MSKYHYPIPGNLVRGIHRLKGFDHMVQDSEGYLSLVPLKNGSEAPGKTVKALVLHLLALKEHHPSAFYEFVMVCRDQSYRLSPSEDTGELLVRQNLIERVDDAGHVRINDTIRNVVLSAVEGTEVNLRIVWPIVTT